MNQQSVEGFEQLKKDELSEKQRKNGVHLRPTAVEKVKGGKNHFTIGYGHYLDNSKGAKAAFEKAWNRYKRKNPKEKMGWEKKRKELQSKTGTLPESVVDDLLKFDITRMIKRAEWIFSVDKNGDPFERMKKGEVDKRKGKSVFHLYSQDMKDVIINSVFRGEMARGQNTVKALIKEDFKGAAEQYLKRRDYDMSVRHRSGDIRAGEKDISGVSIRMDRKHARIVAEATKYERDSNRKGYFIRKQVEPVVAPVVEPAAGVPAAKAAAKSMTDEQVKSMTDAQVDQFIREQDAKKRLNEQAAKKRLNEKPGSSWNLLDLLDRYIWPDKSEDQAAAVGQDTEGVQLAHDILDADSSSFNPYDYDGTSNA